MINSEKILLIGCGKMGLALLKSWINGGVEPENIFVVEHDTTLKNRERATIQKVNYFTSYEALTKIFNYKGFFDFIIIAVKPQNLDETLKIYKPLDNGKTVFTSIAAGKTIKTMQKFLSAKTPIVRTMPNLPATIGQAVTAIFANKNLSKKQFETAKKIFELSGEVVELESEEQFDVVTAVSGSGPAYVFHLIECLKNSAVKLGLTEEIANILVSKTIYGSAKLAYEAEEDATTLRQQVTSKSGTTEAALKVLMNEKAMQKLFDGAIKAATIRSKELNN